MCGYKTPTHAPEAQVEERKGEWHERQRRLSQSDHGPLDHTEPHGSHPAMTPVSQDHLDRKNRESTIGTEDSGNTGHVKPIQISYYGIISM